MLTIKVPRSGRTWLLLASIAGMAGAAAASLFAAFPDWFPLIGLLIVGLLVVWRIWPHGTVKFDTRKGWVLKDGRLVARFAQIECVLITPPPVGEAEPYVVELQLADRAPLFLGYSNDEIEASSLAARVAGAIDRPVKVGGS